MGTHTSFLLELSSGTNLQHLLKMCELQLDPVWLFARTKSVLADPKKEGLFSTAVVFVLEPNFMSSLNCLFTPFWSLTDLWQTQSSSYPSCALEAQKKKASGYLQQKDEYLPTPAWGRGQSSPVALLLRGQKKMGETEILFNHLKHRRD